MRKISIVFAACLFFAGCAAQPQTADRSTEPRDRNNTAVAAVIGAVAGAVIGGQLDDGGNRDRGILVGAAVGATAGATIGAYMDRQEEEFRSALEEEQKRSEIEIERVRDDLLKLTFDSEVTFDFDSAMVKDSFQHSLNKVSSVIQKYNSDAEIVGHTDSVGTEVYNQELSEKRAMAVKIYLLEHGVDMGHLSSYGKGESEPRESNVTEAGRQLNRRVEIFVRPNV